MTITVSTPKEASKPTCLLKMVKMSQALQLHFVRKQFLPVQIKLKQGENKLVLERNYAEKLNPAHLKLWCKIPVSETGS